MSKIEDLKKELEHQRLARQKLKKQIEYCETEIGYLKLQLDLELEKQRVRELRESTHYYFDGQSLSKDPK